MNEALELKQVCGGRYEVAFHWSTDNRKVAQVILGRNGRICNYPYSEGRLSAWVAGKARVKKVTGIPGVEFFGYPIESPLAFSFPVAFIHDVAAIIGAPKLRTERFREMKRQTVGQMRAKRRAAR